MSTPPAAEAVPCERCLDWRIEQSLYVGQHIVDVVTAILAELGHDATDDRVQAIVVAHLRAADDGG